MKTKITKHCKGCANHHVNGIKDGKHNNWCTKFGQPSQKALGRCINTNSKVEAAT